MSKESFILYTEYEEYFNELTDTDAGILIRAIFAYEHRGEITALTGMVKAFFLVIKNTLDRNRQQYETKIQARAEAGRAGGKAKHANAAVPESSPDGTVATEDLANLANARFATNEEANLAVNVHDPVPVHDNDHVPENDPEPVAPQADAFQISKSGIKTNTASTRIESARKAWNSSGASPQERFNILQFRTDDSQACLAAIQAYTDDEISGAIKNYAGIITSPGHEVPFPYRSFSGFMRNGVKNFIAEAKPWESYKKKAQPGIGPAVAPKIKYRCPVCGTESNSSGCCPSCKYDPATDGAPEAYKRFLDGESDEPVVAFNLDQIMRGACVRNAQNVGAGG